MGFETDGFQDYEGLFTLLTLCAPFPLETAEVERVEAITDKCLEDF